MYMVDGYMLRIKAWFIVKLWTIWYYVWHPGMYWKRIKLRNRGSQRLLDLFIGNTMRKEKMIDNKEHDEMDFRKMASWLGMAIIGGLWWYSVFTKGLFVTIVWSIVIMAIGGLWLTIKDMRL